MKAEVTLQLVGGGEEVIISSRRQDECPEARAVIGKEEVGTHFNQDIGHGISFVIWIIFTCLSVFRPD